MSKSKTPVIVNHRNAINGQFVTTQYVKTHPKTTTTEHNRLPTPTPPKGNR